LFKRGLFKNTLVQLNLPPSAKFWEQPLVGQVTQNSLSIMDNLEEKVSEFLAGSDQGEVQSEPEVTSQEVSSEVSSSQEEEQAEEPTYEIEGKSYKLSELKDLLQKAKHYEHLLPEFTRRSQELAELKRKLESPSKQTSESVEDEIRQQALRYLREQLGLVTKEDLEGFLQQVVNSVQTYIEEQNKLQRAIEYLEKKYDGTFFPKFDYEKLKEFLVQKYGEDVSNWPKTIDLHLEYLDMNREFFEKLPEFQRKAVITERGGIPSPGTVVSKKIVEKPTKEDEISLEEAALDFLKNL